MAPLGLKAIVGESESSSLPSLMTSLIPIFSHSWSLSGHFQCVKARAHPRRWPKWNFNRKALSVIGRCDKAAVFFILNDFNDSSAAVV